METTNFDPTSLAVARERIAAIFDGFVAATGIPITAASEILSGDRAFVSRYKRTNITFGTYDLFAGRASALWPDAAAWPEGVPRPAPGDVPANLRDAAERRMTKKTETEEAANG